MSIDGDDNADDNDNVHVDDDGVCCVRVCVCVGWWSTDDVILVSIFRILLDQNVLGQEKLVINLSKLQETLVLHINLIHSIF